MKKKILISTVICVVLLMVSIIGNLWLWTSLNQANAEVKSLETDFQNLLSDYATLNEQHQTLIIEYDELDNSYRILVADYATLDADYVELEKDHEDLFSEHQILFFNFNALVEVFNEPLSYEVVPSTSELESWLWEDKTDEIWYEKPNFVCGDFAVMLSQHAKLEHWDIGVVVIFGYDEDYESYCHVFNVVICTEGLVYIEPQTDYLWWYEDHIEINGGGWWEISEKGYIYVEEYWEILWCS